MRGRARKEELSKQESRQEAGRKKCQFPGLGQSRQGGQRETSPKINARKLAECVKAGLYILGHQGLLTGESQEDWFVLVVVKHKCKACLFLVH